MSSLGEFLNAMVELRRNKAQVAEFNAQQQAAGMSALGGGIGDLLGGLGKGLTAGRATPEDLIANRMMNMAEPPRAIPVNKALADAAPTLREGEVPYDQIPITGQPFTGGKAGFEMANTLNTAGVREARLDAYRQQITEKNLNAADRLALSRQIADTNAAYKQSQTEARDARLELAQQKADADRAKDLLYKAPQKYKDDLAAVRHYYADMKVNMASAAGAKDQYTYDKAVEAITGTYATGEKQGFKVSYPQIPIPAFQREAGQTLETEIAKKQGQYDALWPWQSGAGIKSDIATKQAQLKELGNYNYQSPGLQQWDLPEEPSLDQYIPPQATQPGPSQAQQQGPAPSAAAQEQTMSVADAQKINPNYKSGMLIRDKSTGQMFRVQ